MRSAAEKKVPPRPGNIAENLLHVAELGAQFDHLFCFDEGVKAQCSGSDPGNAGSNQHAIPHRLGKRFKQIVEVPYRLGL